ncbi:MAG: hypothetical protein MK052_02835 [Alphaproteobacteria bacterium]|nr:hypothetical protein [Alphaproteobacteria bacterium]
MLELLQAIPAWLGSAICLGIGWFAKARWDFWKNRWLPYEQDRVRYNYIMEGISFVVIDCFAKKLPAKNFSHAILCDHLYTASAFMQEAPYVKKPYLDSKLAVFEAQLYNCLLELESIYPMITAPGMFGHSDDEAIRRGDALKIAYEKYRNYGNKLFAKKIK